MKALVIATIMVIAMSVFLVSIANAGAPTLQLSINRSPLSPVDPIEVMPGETNVLAGIFRITAGPDTVPHVVIYLRNAGLPQQLNPVSKIYISHSGGGSESGYNPPVDIGAPVYFGTIPANETREFKVSVDISPKILGGTILLGIGDASFVRLVGQGPPVVSGDFPVWGNTISVSTPTPPPIPVPPLVWLSGSALTVPTDTTYVYMGLTSGVGYLSATISVTSPLPILDAKMGGYQESAGTWMLAQSISMGVLNISMAGTTPLEPGAPPFIVFAFWTGQMRLGDRADYQITIRFNEEPVQSIGGKIVFVGIPGDVTVNGEVSAFDAAAVLRSTVGIFDNYAGLILAIADVSGNGEVTAYDAALILQFVAGIIDIFPVVTSTPSTPAGGGSGGGSTTAAGKIAASEPPSVKLGEFVTQADGSMVIPILVDQMEGVLAGQLDVSFGGGGSVQAEPGGLLEGYTVVTLQEEGRIKISFAGSASPSGGGEVLRLKFSQKPKGLRLKVRLNENPSQILSTAVEARSWGEVKNGFLK